MQSSRQCRGAIKGEDGQTVVTTLDGWWESIGTSFATRSPSYLQDVHPWLQERCGRHAITSTVSNRNAEADRRGEV
uniref:Uncharacterized protein n=1 Tax=Chromera velia CCMP2878 TaxID=1169474 RepID=A0A0G4ICU6_9ALVE|eukprot:Cvel_13138.t1-p1 / transcript=Cvel_13138.t1 / gene=Cvel_13138 / organism=Chromera_velia_CCMP2878 / gene_product=hypothetical protein / transcript_product=hypothetical protein / location=Cvel_scaffold886:46239-48334(+) / protein_length=75 / sequence_SO=supercontig / SO=protein_coding / is_pseudo=false